MRVLEDVEILNLKAIELITTFKYFLYSITWGANYEFFSCWTIFHYHEYAKANLEIEINNIFQFQH